MLLVIDVGNTNITVGVFKEKELLCTFRMTTKQPRTSDEYGITLKELVECQGISSKEIRAVIEEALMRDNLAVGVEVSGGVLGHVTYTAPLAYAPTLFGLGLRDEVLGVRLPRLEHRVSLTVDPYKPGMLF